MSHRLGASVGDGVREVGSDVLPVTLESEGHFLDRSEMGSASPSEPRLEVPLHDAEIAKLVDPHEGLLDRPGSRRLQVTGTKELGEGAPLGEWKAIWMSQPVEFGSLEEIASEGT